MFTRKTLSILMLMFVAFPLNASEPESDFNPGEMILNHILDSHEWHIATVGKTHISIPLPILLIHDGKFHAFMSSKFHHGHSDYRGFRLMLEGDYKGKIVAVNSQGNILPKLPIDLSITKNAFSLLFVASLLFLIFVNISKIYKKRGSGLPPTKFQNLIEPIILFVRDDIVKVAIPIKYVDRYLPYLLTLFFFILFCNLLGLVPFFPGGASVTGNVAVTLVLAMFTFVITTVSGNRTYFREIINTSGAPWWMKFPIPLLPAIEVIGVLTKPVVLMIRLFANIMAGHIIILGLISMIFILGNMSAIAGYGVSALSVGFTLFISVLELIVAFVQAFVFTLLTSFYIGMAKAEHH